MSRLMTMFKIPENALFNDSDRTPEKVVQYLFAENLSCAAKVHYALQSRRKIMNVFAVVSAVIVFYIVSQISPIVAGLMLLPLGFAAMWLDAFMLRKIARIVFHNYQSIVEPVIVTAIDAFDDTCLLRRNFHHYCLYYANELYRANKTKVHCILPFDAKHYTETFEEYKARVNYEKKEYLAQWGKKVAPQDKEWQDVYLSGQRL